MMRKKPKLASAIPQNRQTLNPQKNSFEHLQFFSFPLLFFIHFYDNGFTTEGHTEVEVFVSQILYKFNLNIFMIVTYLGFLTLKYFTKAGTSAASDEIICMYDL